MPPRSATVSLTWVDVQLSHINLGSNALHKKIPVGRETAAASSRGNPKVRFVPVTMGDQNLTKSNGVGNAIGM